MGVLDAVRGKDHTRTEESYSQNEKSAISSPDGQHDYDPETPPSSDGSYNGDVFDDARELAHHPDTVTSGAELGQQKAEAAALVWSWPVLVGLYAW
jgi:hypothetical protein